MKRSAMLLCITLLVCGAYAACAAQKALPVLRWTERSDWLNVMRDVAPKAVGDGVADDSDAIQAALDRLVEWESGGPVGGPKVVYLPAGTYRITKTLHVKKMSGMLLVGCGRETRIVWDGAEGKPMCWSDGMRSSRFIGLVWDGRNKARAGVMHASTSEGSYFETENMHQCEAFVDIPGFGVSLGEYTQPGLATDNTIFENCLFQHCGKGISVDQFNFYHYSIDNCEFRQCGTGVYFRRGMGYIRNSHFEGSTEQDCYFYLGHPVDCSVRRSTSVGSRRFLTVAGGGWSNCACVEDCQVSGWTDPDGAIVTNDAGTLVIFDMVFSHPPSKNPPIKLANALPNYQVRSRCPTMSAEAPMA